MNNSIARRIFSAIFTLFMALVMTACATHGQKETASTGDGDKVFASAVIRVDSLVRKTSAMEGTVYELDAIQIGFKELNGQWVMYFDEKQKKMVPAITRFHRETKTTPFGREVTLTFVGGVLPTIVQGEYAKQLAKETSCKPGSICAENVNVNTATGGIGLGGQGGHGGNAAAGSSAGSYSGSNASVNGGCATCAFKPN